MDRRVFLAAVATGFVSSAEAWACRWRRKNKAVCIPPAGRAADLPPVIITTSSGNRTWELTGGAGCYNRANGRGIWDPLDCRYIDVPVGGHLSLYQGNNCMDNPGNPSQMWVGSGRTDLNLLGLHNNLHSLSFVRWSAAPSGPSPFVLRMSNGRVYNLPARNDVVNFDGNNIPDNALRYITVPTGYACHVCEDRGCQFRSNRFYEAGTHDLALDNFHNRVSSIWTIKL